MQIHLQRVVGPYVGSAHSAGEFYSRAVSEARDATAKSADESRDEDRNGPVGFDSTSQRKGENQFTKVVAGVTCKDGTEVTDLPSERRLTAPVTQIPV